MIEASDKASGLTAFRQRYPKASVWLVGDTGISLADFFSRPGASVVLVNGNEALIAGGGTCKLVSRNRLPARL